MRVSAEAYDVCLRALLEATEDEKIKIACRALEGGACCEERRAWRNTPSGSFAEEEAALAFANALDAIVELPRQGREVLDVRIRKLACALFWREI